jgi:hypothetical protein
MNADKSTPPSGESVTDASVDYQKLGQTLLSRELERHAYDLREVFMSASVAVDRDGDLDADDLLRLEVELEQARFLVEDLREAMGND